MRREGLERKWKEGKCESPRLNYGLLRCSLNIYIYIYIFIYFCVPQILAGVLLSFGFPVGFAGSSRNQIGAFCRL